MKTQIVTLLFLFATLAVFSQTVGEPAPDFSLTDTNGETFQLSEHQGKVVTVFLFGYGCPSCKAIAPDVQEKLAAAFADHENYTIVGVDAWNGNTSQVKGFVSSTNITFPALQMGSEMANSWGTTYDRIIVIGADGTMVFKGSGLASSHIDQAITAVEDALGNITTSIQNVRNSTDNVQVYPNPASEVINIVLNSEHSEIALALMDITGRERKRLKYENPIQQPVQFPINDYQPGVYFLRIEMGESVQTRRLIIR